MNIKQICIFLILFKSVLLLADVPRYDIIQVEFEQKKYYVKGYFNEDGILKNHDLRYYNYSTGEYADDVRNYILNYSPNEDSIMLYESLERIDVRKLSCYEGNNLTEPDNVDNFLKILNKGKNVSMEEFKTKFKLLDAFHGNTGGFEYSLELKESDNEWINKFEIQKLFCLDGYEICNYGFFAIKGKLSKRKIEKLKVELENIIKLEDSYLFEKKVSELYKQQIIMIGFCSC